MKPPSKIESAKKPVQGLRSQSSPSKRPLPFPTIAEVLREDFMKPLGITTAELRAAIMTWPGDFHGWDGDLRLLFSKRDCDEFLVVDLALVLDRIFGMPDGYFLRLWAICAGRSRARKKRGWLVKVKPLGLADRRKKLAVLWASAPEFPFRGLETAFGVVGREKIVVSSSKPSLPPPKGYASWLDYAVETMETRRLYNEHRFDQRPPWRAHVDRDCFRTAARTELEQLRRSTWAACPAIECIDHAWVFAGTRVPVVKMFEALGAGPLTIEKWQATFAPRVTADQIRTVFACVRQSLEPTPP